MTTIKVVDAKDVWNGKLFKITGDNGKSYKVWKEDFDVTVGATISGNEEEVEKNGFKDVFIKKPKAAGKPFKPGGFSGGSKGGNESFALSYAKDISVALINNEMLNPNENNVAEYCMAMANQFLDWLNSKAK